MIKLYTNTKKSVVAFLVGMLTLVGFNAYAQPTVLGTHLVNGSYVTYDYIYGGGSTTFTQFRIQATSSAGSNTGRQWEFAGGTAGSPSYNPVWRPYTSGNVLSVNTYIPTTFSNGARYNTGGGASGELPAITANNYYTFNVYKNTAADNIMQLLETTFNPTAISSVTQSPASPVPSNNSVTVTITTAAAPAVGENVYVRYTTNAFVASTLVQATFVGNVGTAIIPCSATAVTYYVYSSNKTIAQINADVVTYGQAVHDMSTLSINNNSGANYTYAIAAASTNFSGAYLIPSTCYPTLASFVTAINGGAVTGAVNVYVTPGYTETAPAGGYNITATGTAANPIVFQRNGAGANPVFTAGLQVAGSLTDAVFKIVGGDYITIQNFTIAENAANTVLGVSPTFPTNTMTEFGIAQFYASATNGAQNNTFQNNTISLNRLYANSFGIYSNARTTATAPTVAAEITSASGSNSFCKIYGNIISNVNYGIVMIGSGALTAVGGMDNGTDIGGNSAGTGNTITGWGGCGITPAAYIGIPTTSTYCITVNNAYNDNVSYNNITSFANGSTVGAITMGGILNYYSVGTTAQPTGTITKAITNNTITITATPIAAGASIVGINNQGLSPLLNTATININNNTVQNCNINGTTATTSGITAITNASIPGTLNMNANSVLSNTITTTAGAQTGSIFGIQNTGAATTASMSNNIVTGSTISTPTATSAALSGINNSGACTNMNMNTNQVKNFSLFNTTGATQCILNIGAMAGTLNMNNNTISGIAINPTAAATGTLFLMYNSATITTLLSMSNNTIQNNTLLNTTGAIYALYNSNSSPNANIQNNIVNNISRAATATAGTFYGHYNASGPTGIQNFSGNSITNIANTPTTGTGVFYGMYNLSSASSTWNVYNNTVTGITNGSGSTYGIYDGYGAAGSTAYGNVINTIAGGGTVYGLFLGASLNAASTAYSNKINTLSSTGASSTVYGILTSAVNPSIYKNKIYDLSTTGANAAVYGLSSSSATLTAYNNYIGDLRAPSLNAAVSLAGINISGGTTANLYYNTVYLNATSSGAAFGSSALYGSSVTKIVLRNNILVNISTPVGATGFTAAFRRSGVTTQATYYDVTSNNNLYWAGTASATNLIYYDGTNSDQTLAAFKTRVTPSDAASVTENPPFLSTTGAAATYLHINPATATQAESGAVNIATPLIADDYDADIRQGNTGYPGTGTAPDIGADEFAGISPTPTITLNSFVVSPATAIPGATAQCSATARDISVAVTTPSGTITSVTITYNNGTAVGPVSMTNAGAGNWTFTIPAASPVNTTVTWSATVTNSFGFTKTYTGASYADVPTFGVTATATASPTTICLGGTSTLTATLAVSSIAPTYTAPPAVTNPTTDEDFGNITITQGAATILNNTTAGGSLVGTIGTATGTAGSFSNFTAFGPYVLTKGTTYNFSASNITQGGSFGNAIAIYIDYNRNGVFTDAGELVYTSASTTTGPHTETGSFIVPATSGSGLLRMRIIANEGLIASPTTSVTWGEYEEYMLNILPAVSAYSWSDGASIVGSTNPLAVTPIVNTTYTGTLTVSGCPVTTIPSVVVTVNPLPTAPTTTNSSQCGTAIPSASVADPNGFGATRLFKWYDAATGGTLLQSNISTTYLSNVAATTNFYVSVTNPVTGCESPRTQVTVTIVSAPALALSANQVACNNQVYPIAVTTGQLDYTTYVWTPATNLYTDAAGTVAYVPGASATNVWVKSTTAGAVTYTCTANNTVSLCSNTATSIITIQPVVTGYTVPTATYCLTGTPTITTIPASGYAAGSLQWQSSTVALAGPYTDISGATVAAYTAASAITATTYYQLIVKDGTGAVCGTAPQTTIIVNNPSALPITSGTRCGTGTVTLAATLGGTATNLNWYAAATGGVPLQSSNATTFTTPSISTTTNYYVSASVGVPVNAVVGAGALTSASGGFSPYYHGWGGVKSQFIILASELTSAGLLPGNISGLSFEITTLGTATFNNFSVNVGNTAQSVATTTNIGGTTQVYTNAAQALTAGVNTYTFSTPFVWNGTSNIVVQTCYSNVNTGGTSSTVKYDTPGFTSATYTYADNQTAAAILATVTGSTGGSGSTLTATGRPKMTLIQAPCESPRTLVAATVTTPPPFALTNTTSATLPYAACNGGITQFDATYTSGDYNNVTWTVTGGSLFTDAAATTPYITGTNFNTVYLSSAIAGTATVTSNASNAAGCTNIATKSVTILPATLTATASPVAICISGTSTLSLSPSTAASYTGATIQWQSSTDNITFADISGANALTYPTATLTATTYYKATLKNTAGLVCSITSNVVTVTVNNPTITATTPGTRCGTGTVVLGATANSGSTINWYAAVTGGVSLGTGTSFTTPSISATTNYFAEASSGTSSSQTSSNGVPTVTTTTINTGLVLDISIAATLTSLDVYSTAAGTVTMQLVNSAGTVIAGPTSGTVIASTLSNPQNINLGWSLPVGTGYKILVTAQTGALGYHSGTFPSPLGNGVGNIVTGATLSGTTTLNYFLYNLRTTVGCASARTSVSATITTAPSYAVSTPQYTGNPAAFTVCNGAATQFDQVSTLGDYDSFTWTTTLGNLYLDAGGTTPYVGGTSANTVYLISTVGGTATVTGNSANTSTFCTNVVTKTVTILPAIVTTVASPATICISGITTLSLSPVAASNYTGATFQWESSPDGITWTPISGATGLTYTTGTISTSTYYHALLSNTALVACTPSTPLQVVVNNPSVATTTPGTRCGTGALSLGATGAGGATLLNWYAAASGGIALQSSASTTYNTTNITATTTYYVSGSTTPVTTSGLGNTSIPTTTGASNSRGIVFTANTNGMIVSAQYYSPTLSVTNTVTVLLVDNGSGTTLNTLTLPIVQGASAGWYTMNLNLPVTAGTTYRLLAGFTSSVNRISTGADYTLSTFNNLAPLGVITSGYDGGVTTTAYNYFHNIVVQTYCESARTAVVATVTTPPAITPPANTSICAGTPTNLTVMSGNAGYTYSWSPATGLSTTTGATVSANPTTTTTYTITATDAGSGCNTTGSVTVTVNPIPTGVTATATPTTLCSGGNISLTSAYNSSSLATPATSMNNYTPTRNTGTPYTSIIPATQITTWRNGLSTDDNLSDNQPIGFTFNYGGTTYTNFRVSTNGFITFNTTSTAIGSGAGAYGYSNSWTVASGGLVVAPNWDDLQTAANLGTLADLNNSINYTTTGSAGSRVCTVEWKNMQDFNSLSDASYNFQVKLYESDNHIEFVYGTMQVSTQSPSLSYSLGLSAATVSASPLAAELLSQTTANTATFGFTNSNALATLPATNTTIVFNTPSATPNYSWTGPNGFTSTAANPTITAATAAASGVYNLIITNPTSLCPSAQAQTATVTVTPQPNATIAYTGSPYCTTGTASVTLGGTVGLTGGTYTSTAGLSINTSTGDIDLGLSTPGTYTITYTVAAAGGCAVYTTNSAPIKIIIGGTWVGGVDDNWNNPANWPCGGVPFYYTNVIIPAGANNYPKIVNGQTANCGFITIAAGASVTVTGTGIFSMNGNVTNAGIFDLTDGTLRLANDAGGIPPLIQLSGASVKNKSIKNLVIAVSSQLSNTVNDTLKITNNLSFEGSSNNFSTFDNLTLVSNAAGTASLKDITNNGTANGNVVTGKVNVERYISTLRKWRYLAINTVGSQTIQNSWMEGVTPGVNGLVGRGVWITDALPGPGTGFDGVSYSATMKYWNGTSYTNVTDPTTYQIQSQTAYMTYVRGDRTCVNSGPGLNYTAPTTLRTKGTLIQNTTAATTVPAGGTNLVGIGNPYASAIDLTKLIYSTPGIINIAVWDPKLGGSYGLGAFQTLTSAGSGADFTITPGGGSYTSNTFGTVMNSIESGQGFFVYGSAANRNVQFPEVAKTPKVNDVFFTNGNPQSIHALISIKDAAGTATVMDGVAVYIDKNNNSSIDAADARKLVNINENLSINSNNVLLALERRGLIDETDSIKLNMTGLRVSNYQWKLAIANLDEPGREGYLLDKFLHTKTNLNLNGINLVDFNVANVAGSYAADRFVIVFKQTAVPAIAINIAANRNGTGEQVSVKWTTSNEAYVGRYNVERGSTNTSFAPIQSPVTVTNNNGGTVTYSFTDLAPSKGENFYRIKADRTINSFATVYSPIAKVDAMPKDSYVNVYPNPVTEGVIKLEFVNKQAGTYTIKMLDKTGKAIRTDAVTISTYQEIKTIDIGRAIAAGTYTLMIQTPTENEEMKQIIVK